MGSIKRECCKEAAEKPILTQEEFEEACNEAMVPEKAFQDGMRDRLAQLGIALKPVKSTEDVYVLQPSWVTHGIYEIIRTPMICLKNGLLPLFEARKRLPDDLYRGNLKNFILDLMVGYELALYDDANKRENMLVPALAPEVEPDTGDWTDSTEIYYQYDELIEGIIPRLIIGNWEKFADGLQVSKGTFWRTGVILTYKSCRIRVSVRENECLYVQVSGPAEIRTVALDRTREAIEKVNSAFANLNPDEYVSFGPGASILYVDLLGDFEDGSKTRRVGGRVRDVEAELFRVIKGSDQFAIALRATEVEQTSALGSLSRAASLPTPASPGISHPWFHILVPSTLVSGALAFGIYRFTGLFATAPVPCAAVILSTFLALAKFGYDMWKGGTRK